MKNLKEIVVLRLQQLNLGAVEAATKAGIERTYIRDIVEDKKKSVRSDKLKDLARALELNAEALAQGHLVPIDFIPDDDNKVVSIPLISTVSAGAMLRDDVRDEAIMSIEVVGIKKSDWIALKVTGDSMDRISPPESLILIDRNDKRLVTNACYVIADHEGNATYKRFRADPIRFEPVSTNPIHEPIFPDREPVIIGRVKRTMLDM